MNRPILLNPGPVTLSERVRGAMQQPDLCHREPEFAALQAEIRVRLASVYPHDELSAVLLTGSGTCAVEAMLATLVPRDGLALVVANGVYGERMAAMLAVRGRPHELIAAGWARPLPLEAVARRLASGPPVSHIATVHHETTTGRLNDLPALAAICRQYGVPLLLDAVSSFGAEAIDLDGWGVEACAATANKCLHGVPGIAFVLARRSALARPSAADSLYLDLGRAWAEQERGSSPFTPAVHAAYALREALHEHADAGGWPARHQLYLERSTALRATLADLGVSLLVPAEACAASLSAFALPEGLSYADLHAALKAAGFVIYAGQGTFAGTIFRIATMGEISAADLVRLQRALRDALSSAAPPARPTAF